MGVKDLWKILKPTGRPVNPDSLHGLVLGVDVSIWLNQAIKGMRDGYGNEIPNAHLLVLFNRICKLLHYQIKPVFVFDGPAPPLKLQTLELRKRRKQKASTEVSGLLGKRALKMLEAHALQTVTGQEIKLKIPKSLRGGSSRDDEDIFQMPETTGLSLAEEKEQTPIIEEEEESSTGRSFLDPRYELFSNEAESIDIESEDFSALPPEMQHDLLLEKKELQKHSYSNPSVLPKKAHDFSDYQLARLMNRSNVTRKLEDVRKSLNASQSACYGIPEGKECDIEAKRIESYEGRHYILIRGKNIGDSSQGESQDEADGFLSLDFRNEEVRYVARTTKEESTVSEEDTSNIDDDFQDFVHSSVSKMHGGLTETPLSSSSDDENAGEMMEKEITAVGSNDNTTSVSCSDLRSPLDTLGQSDINTPSQDSVTPSNQQRSPSSNTSRDIPATESISCHRSEHNSQAEPHRPLTVESVQAQSNTIQPTQTQSSSVQLSSNQSNTVPSQSNPVQISSTQSYAVQSPPITTNLSNPYPSDVQPMQVIVSDQTSSDSDSFTDEGGTVPDPVPEVLHVPFQPDIVDANYADAVLQEAKELLHQPMKDAQQVIVEQVLELEKKTAQQEKQSVGVTSVMYQEAQELLKLFGLPYIESPSEAEAQCATLENLELTQGTVTDDSDVLLFGGQSVYRNMFSPDKDLELYFTRDILSLLGLDRDKLVVLAYFLGSDYTEGLEGIGCVNAMELLGSFSGEGLEPLKKIKEWNMEAKVRPGLQVNETSLQKKVRLLNVPHSFPNEAIREAYLTPAVDTSTEAFEWGQPDLDLLRQYTLDKFGWKQDQCDKLLLPVIRRANMKQNLITSYSVPTALTNPSHSGLFLKSKRLRKAVGGLTGQSSSRADSTQSESKRKSSSGRGMRRGGRGRRGKKGNLTSCKRQLNEESSEETDNPKRQKRKNSSTLPMQSSSSSSSSSSSDNDQ